AGNVSRHRRAARHRRSRVADRGSPPLHAGPAREHPADPIRDGDSPVKVDASRGKLYDAQKVTRSRWDQVSEAWSDQVKAEFEEQTWRPLDQLASDGLRAIDRLAQILTECRRECSGER